MTDMVLVPREPTREMLEAAAAATWDDYDDATPARRAAYHSYQATAYRAMFSAALRTEKD